jgi:hypothetical protein
MMATRSDLLDWVHRAVKENGGSATLVQVAQHIWRHHESDLRRSGDLFFTWQYDMRWAATKLRELGKFRSADVSARGQWELA